MNILEEKKLFQILFFNRLEYNLQNEALLETGQIKITEMKKVGTLYLKILFYADEIINCIQKAQESLQKLINEDEYNKILGQLFNNIRKIDNNISNIIINEIYSKIEKKKQKIQEYTEILEKSNNITFIDREYYNKQLEKITSLSEISFIISILKDDVDILISSRDFIEYYYNLFDDVNKRKLFNDQKLAQRIFNIQKYNFNISVPSSKKFSCIIDNNKVCPASSVMIDSIIKLNENMELTYDNVQKLMYSNDLENTSIFWAELYNIYSVKDFLNAYVNYFLENNIKVCKCKNCNKYFIPENKKNETLCNNIYKNQKTCKELSYEIKLQNDIITNTYRKAYKSQNAKKQRNKHIPEIEERFTYWVSNAQKKKKACIEKKISLDEFKEWLKESENWYLGG